MTLFGKRGFAEIMRLDEVLDEGRPLVTGVIIKRGRSRAWWRTLVIPALGRLRLEDPGSRPASAT